MLKHFRTRGRALLLLATFTLLAFAAASCTNEAEPVKIGILHSLTGTMAISETSLRDAVLMAVDEINAKGGVLGRQDRARCRRSRIRLGPVRGESPAVDHPGQGGRGLRLLDVGQPEVRASRCSNR